MTPDRLTTERLEVSMVVKRRWQSVHSRRRRMAEPSSAVRESMTRESAFRQNGQCTPRSSLVGRPAARHRSGARYGRPTTACKNGSAGGDDELLPDEEVTGGQAVELEDVVDGVTHVTALGGGGRGDGPEGVPRAHADPFDGPGVGLGAGHRSAQ